MLLAARNRIDQDLAAGFRHPIRAEYASTNVGVLGQSNFALIAPDNNKPTVRQHGHDRIGLRIGNGRVDGLLNSHTPNERHEHPQTLKQSRSNNSNTKHLTSFRTCHPPPDCHLTDIVIALAAVGIGQANWHCDSVGGMRVSTDRFLEGYVFMAFWKKGKAESPAEEKKAAPSATSPSVAVAQVVTNGSSPEPKPAQNTLQQSAADRQGGVQAAAQAPASAAARQNALSVQNVRRAVAFSQVIGLMTRSPSLRELKIGALPALVMPAIQLGQFSVAQARNAEGQTAPIGAVLWASVSDALDAELSNAGALPPALQLKDWRSGPHLWIMLHVGDERVIATIVQQLKTTQWKGHKVKRIVRKEGAVPAVEVL
ncbi:MAG: toxin-activating lysine-acyltransferase [Hyphomicrobiaceae bacterium]